MGSIDHLFTLALVSVVQDPDTALLSSVRAAVAQAPIENFGQKAGTVTLRGIELLDLDRDGISEAFVWIQPSFRQTPTVLVYRYSATTGPVRLLEGLAPGRLTPISGALEDSHTLGRAIDMTVGDGTQPVDTARLIGAAVEHGMTLIRYREFLHADQRNGFVTFVDLYDRALPPEDTKTCERFEFSRLEGLLAGRLVADSSGHYLVALTPQDITIYHFDGVRPDGTLIKTAWTSDRPPSATRLVRLAGDYLALRLTDSTDAPIEAPNR